MMFALFVGLIVIQRLVELIIARRNEKWMKDRGGVEFGQGHYPAMILIHISFFFVYISEVVFMERNLSGFWPVLLSLFILTQAMRIWALSSLGPFWNTKIIILPGADVIKKGPYKIIKHPNYLIVTIELIVIPLLFNAYITAVLFTLLNMVILAIRIPAEEEALIRTTKYGKEFSQYGRFVPNLLNKCDNKRVRIENDNQ